MTALRGKIVMTLELEVGHQVVVGRDGVDAPSPPNVPHVHCVILTRSAHVVTNDNIT